MPTSRRTLLKNSAATAAVLTLDWTRAQAEAETVRLGIIYDLTGPFAAGGSVACSVGTQIAVDLVNEKGGVGGKRTGQIIGRCRGERSRLPPAHASSQGEAQAAWPRPA